MRGKVGHSNLVLDANVSYLLTASLCSLDEVQII